MIAEQPALQKALRCLGSQAGGLAKAERKTLIPLRGLPAEIPLARHRQCATVFAQDKRRPAGLFGGRSSGAMGAG